MAKNISKPCKISLSKVIKKCTDTKNNIRNKNQGDFKINSEIC